MSLIHQNWWFTTLLVRQHKFCPPLSKSLKCDVLIVGGGVSGISAAAEFVKQGRSMVLIERNVGGGGSAGRSGISHRQVSRAADPHPFVPNPHSAASNRLNSAEQYPMKMNSTLLAITAGLAGMSLHAAPVPSPTTSEAALTAREYRTNLLRDELSARDTRIEGRIDLIIDALRATGDSKDSGGKVARMKEQTIAALNKTIAYYQTKRAALQEEMSRPSLRLTDEQKRKIVDIFDARIEKRIAQVFVVQRSLPGHTDFERYRVGLRDSIARIEQQSELKMQNAPPEEIAKNKALLAARRRQLAASLAPTGGATQNVGESVARDLDRALQTEIAELRKEFTTLFARYSVYLQELSALN